MEAVCEIDGKVGLGGWMTCGVSRGGECALIPIWVLWVESDKDEGCGRGRGRGRASEPKMMGKTGV